MRDGLLSQLDYVLFFYGFAFALLAVVCHALRRGALLDLRWGWLGLFALAHGAQEWWELLAFSLGQDAPLARSVLAAVSFSFLVEFGRSSMRSLRGRGPGPWILAPLLVATALLTLATPLGLNTSGRYVLGLVGGLWSGAALFRAAQAHGQRSQAAAMAGTAMALYAVATGLVVAPAAVFPASVLNTDTFFAAVGVPIQLVRGGLAVWLSISLWLLVRARAEDELDGRTRTLRRNLTYGAMMGVLLLVGGGWALTQIVGKLAAQQARAELDRGLERMRDAVESRMAAVDRVAQLLTHANCISDALRLQDAAASARAKTTLDRYCVVMPGASCHLALPGGRIILSHDGAVPDRQEERSVIARYAEQASWGAAVRDFGAGNLQRATVYYAASPVLDEGGEVLGSVIVSSSLSDIAAGHRPETPAFLVDSGDRVLLAFPVRERRAAPACSSARDIAALLAAGQGTARPVGALLSQPSQPASRWIAGSATLSLNGWRIALLESTRLVALYRLAGIGATLLICLGLIVGIGIWSRLVDSTARIAASERRYRGLVEGAPNWITLLDEGGICLTANQNGLDALGWAEGDIIGKPFPELWPVSYQPQVQQSLSLALAGEQVSFDGNFVRGDGRAITWHMILKPIVDGDGGVIRRVVAIGMDITDRQQAQERLDFLANHDPLTGLPNRLLFSDRFKQAIRAARRRDAMVALLFLDLDRFKRVNDTLGHAFGDRLLQAVAQRLRQCVREGDTVARLGGDEFTLILEDIHHDAAAAGVATKVLSALAEPFDVDEHELYLSASIGISLFPADGTDVETLSRNADTAMYLAKDKGRANYQFFTEALNQKAVRQLALETRLRRALQRDELQVLYQPQVDLGSARVVGVEALLRWDSPDLGSVRAQEFIAIAEDTGLIEPIGEWVLRTACVQARAWQAAGLPPLALAVNLSPRQFRWQNLTEVVQHILADTGLAADLLTLELTESALLQDTEMAVPLLRGLRALGPHIAVDDFGIGYSSLSYLKRFPLEQLKVAQEFVRGIPGDPNDTAIARAIISLGKSLGLTIIAEGVETPEQLEFFVAHGADRAQGYLFCEPVPASQLSRFVQTWPFRAPSLLRKGANFGAAG